MKEWYKKHLILIRMMALIPISMPHQHGRIYGK